MNDRNERMTPVATIASIVLHAAIAIPVIFDLDLFGGSLEEPVIAFAVGMVPLSEVTAAPQVGEITPPRPLERLEEPAGNEAREVETVDAEAPEQAPSAQAAPESQSEPPAAEEVPTEAPPQVAETEAPPPLLTAPETPPAASPEPQPAPPPDLADPELQEAPNAPAPDAAEVAALDAPILPSEPQPEDRPADPAVPAPPMPPERTQARVRTDPEPAEDEEDDEEPPVEAVTPPPPEPLPEETQLAVLEPPPLPSFTPQRERAPEPPTPPTPVIDDTAEPPDEPSAIDSVLQSLESATAANSAQGTGSDIGSGGQSGTGTAQSGARLTGATLTLSEEEALRAQLARCWLLPAGAQGIENMTVTIRAVMRPDATIEGRAEIIDPQNRRATDPAFNAFAESAYRAVMTCQPLLLPSARYADWNVLNLNFDPREMF